MPAKRWHALPSAAYAVVDEMPGTVLLEGAAPRTCEHGETPLERPWTRLFVAPLRLCVAYHGAQIPELFAQVERAVQAGLCVAGFFSYECGAVFEPRAGMLPPRPEMPLAWFGIYEREYRFDHERGKFVDGAPPEISRRSDAGLDSGDISAADFALPESEYARRIASIHEYIRAGDIYQLNFTAPLRVCAAGNAASIYTRLRARQPAAYGAFLHWQRDRRILSFSPELFFRIDAHGPARRITTRPMKGTARRGRTTREDGAMAEWLRSDEKNRSENLMIVDLVRNDLGKIARTGSVRVEKLFEVERLPMLWQMTSTITAELRDDASPEAVFRALFPCGSVTGAPKVRAMQLIGELEDVPRGVYTGAIGFFSPQETVFNVAIRTLQLESGRGAMGVGSGVVIDSRAEVEYRECLLKAEFLMRGAASPANEFSLIETMLWQDGCCQLLDLHLDRLADSAGYFDFPCDRAEIKADLEALARSFAGPHPQRVRLLLDASGETRITHEPLLPAPDPDRIGCVSIALQRTDAADPMLFHKTTHRPLYARAFEEASRKGCDDVLFFNEGGELTEGAISNVFIEKGGRWFTPPLECGLLAGVYRRFLLEQKPEIEECVLREADLRAAGGIYIANAVRGLRRVKLTGC